MKIICFLFIFHVFAFSEEIQLNSKIYVAGHNGLVGSAIIRKLKNEGYSNIVTRSSSELDLRCQQAVSNFFQQEKPEYVFLAAAHVGGIKANSDYPATFIYNNIMIEANIIHSAYQNKTKKLLFLGSSCIYPKNCEQPITESSLLTGTLETTNEPYAIAKIAGIKMCQSYNKQYKTNFISCMPTNLYGPNDNFDLNTSHVIPAMIRKFVEAKEKDKDSVTIWGSGTPKREFLHVDDLADASLFLMRHYDDSEIINIGCGDDISILEIAELIKEIVGYNGKLIFDQSYPDGTAKKLLNITKLKKLGWESTINLKDGIKESVKWYYENKVY